MLREIAAVFTYQDSGGEFWFMESPGLEQYSFPCDNVALKHARPREGEQYWLLLDSQNRLLRVLSRRQ